MLYTILDIETTGFSREHDNMLEFGYMQIDKNLRVKRYGTLYFYKDGWKVNTPAQRVHGLTESVLREHETEFDDNLIKVYTMMKRGVIIGKNSDAFDIPFINSVFQRYAEPLYPVNIRGTLDLQTYYTDRYRAYYAQKYGEATKKKGTLEELVEMIGYSDSDVRKLYEKYFPGQRVGAHSALYDVFMTYLLVDYAVKKYGMSI